MSPVSVDVVTIAILAKTPIPGRVKTRLAMLLGTEGAATLHERLVARTVETATAAAIGPVTLWVTPDEQHKLFQDLAQKFPITIARQPDGDLGSRMHAAITEANAPTLVIGSDCPALTPAHLRDAAEVLRSGSEAVVYPAEDGGYVLIGLMRPVPGLFSGMTWSTDTVMVETRNRLRHLGLIWREPVQLWDVDRATDVRRMRRDGMADLLAGIDKRA
jgi:uncharacterized protein